MAPLFRRSQPASVDGQRWIVAGLGNPGPRYERTRHNLGAMVVHALIERLGVSLKRHKSGCLIAEAIVAGERVVLARSTSYMNESGRSFAELVRWYKSSPERLVVVHDELDIPFEEVRVKLGGGTAGHNGLASMAAHLGSKEFVRVRVGVSRPPGARDAADYVLTEFTAAERKRLPDVVERACEAVERVIEVGVERAMNEVNTRR